MRFRIWTSVFLVTLAQYACGQTSGNAKLVSTEATATEPSANSYVVLGATPEQAVLIRTQIRVMQPDVYPLRVLFVPHWKYIDTARTFRLHVPTGYTSAMFTHLPSRSVFIDSDRYVSDDSLGYWLAHELGHLATNSASENDADKAAREYRKRLKDDRPPNTKIPLKLAAGYLVMVQGRIGAYTNLEFVLDTGVTHSVLDRKLASKLALPSRSGRVINFDKAVSSEWMDVPQIEFGPINVSDFPMMLGSLEYLQTFADHVDAVIGLDLLRSSSFSLDYSAKKVVFGPGDVSKFSVPMRSDRICLTVEVQIDGRPFRLLVDTGLKGLVLYEERVSNRIPSMRIVREINGVSMGGQVQSRLAVLPRVFLDRTELDPRAFLVKAPPGNSLLGIDGYLGTEALRARRIDFNFETNMLSWQR
jgi:predicted aspartyl protease